MILNPVWTRRAILSSSILTALSQQRLPTWMMPDEASLLDRIVRTGEGSPLEELQKASFEVIRESIGDAQVVLIGEATHGTEEFYQIRAELTKLLLEQEGFDAVLCEGDFPPFFDLNRFVGGAPASRSMSPDNYKQETPHAPASVDEAMVGLGDRFPEWMWMNNVMRDFVAWLAEYNTSRRVPVQLLGLDIYSMFRSVDEVIGYLVDAGEMRLAQMAADRYSTLNSFRPEPTSYGKAVLYNAVPSQADNVSKLLTSLYKKENKLYQIPGDGQELFNALENARVVSAAEAYYRQMYYPGDETWNLRDSAFLDVIADVVSYIQRKKGEIGSGSEQARVIVWAHNSHVGDASATEYASRGRYNVGQLCRQVFGKENVYIIGFSGYDGTVRAARKWGDKDQKVKLNSAIEGSHEYLLHLIAKSRRKNTLGFCLRSNSAAGESHVDKVTQELFSADRIQRFVGVSYVPKTELQSHYSICNMSQEFDYVFHVDHSNALRVDKAAKPQDTRNGSKDTKRYMFLLDKYGEDYENLVDAEAAPG